MGHRPASLAVLALWALCVLLAGPAHAQESKEEALRHFETGIALISGESRDYRGALVEFQASVQLYPTKSGLYNLGLCYQRLSRYAEALETYDRMERDYGDALGEQLSGDIGRQREEIARITGQLTIVVGEVGATIRLDGELIGKSPLEAPLLLGPREYALEVTLEGFEPVRKKVVLSTGARLVETVAMRPLPGALMVSSGEVSGALVSVDGHAAAVTPLSASLKLEAGPHVITVSKAGYQDAAEQRVTLERGGTAALTFRLDPIPTPAPPPPKPDSAGLGTAWAVGIGLTATSALVAGIFWFQADQRHDDFVAYDDQVKSGAVKAGDPDAAQLDRDRQSAADDTERYSAAAIGFGIGAAVLAAATAVLIGVDLSDGEGEDEGVAVTAGGLVVRF